MAERKRRLTITINVDLVDTDETRVSSSTLDEKVFLAAARVRDTLVRLGIYPLEDMTVEATYAQRAIVVRRRRVQLNEAARGGGAMALREGA